MSTGLCRCAEPLANIGPFASLPPDCVCNRCNRRMPTWVNQLSNRMFEWGVRIGREQVQVELKKSLGI